MKMKHKFMKKILLTIVAALPLLAAAQARIAIVDSKAVFDVMPAKAAAEAQLKVVTDAYQAELDKLRADFDSKFADYQASADDASTPATIKERRMQEVMEGDKKIQAFEKAAKADSTARRDSLMVPIEKAIKDATSRPWATRADTTWCSRPPPRRWLMPARAWSTSRRQSWPNSGCEGPRVTCWKLLHFQAVRPEWCTAWPLLRARCRGL